MPDHGLQQRNTPDALIKAEGGECVQAGYEPQGGAQEMAEETLNSGYRQATQMVHLKAMKKVYRHKRIKRN